MKTKLCTECKETKPLTRFSVKTNPHRTTAVYHNAYCNDCMKRRFVAWRMKNHDRFNTYQNKYKKTKYHEDIEASRALNRKRYHERKARLATHA